MNFSWVHRILTRCHRRSLWLEIHSSKLFNGKLSRARNPQSIAISFEFSLICLFHVRVQERCVLHYLKCYQFNSLKPIKYWGFFYNILQNDYMTDLQQYSISVGKINRFNSGISFKCNTFELLMILKGDAGMDFSRTAVYCDLCCLHLVNFVGESVWG